MVIRAAKLSLLSGLALLFTLVVFNNLNDFDVNYQFVRHVMSMDTTLPGNHGLWRAIVSPSLHLAFHLGIIAWEIVVAILLWLGAVRLLRALRKPAPVFNEARGISILGLTLSLLLWLVAFLAVGGEWFLMWQSHLWNGQEEAFRMFVTTGVVLLILVQPEADPGH